MPRILIVEDTQKIRMAMAATLEDLVDKEGGLLEAEDGEAALKMLKTEKVQAVVTDILMPKMAGLEFLRLLRADPRTQDLPVIVVSGIIDKWMTEHLVQYNVLKIIRKPFEIEVLQDAVKQALLVVRNGGETGGDR
jgi:two-component system, chemotaxis family, chemotaxis protein CheY